MMMIKLVYKGLFKIKRLNHYLVKLIIEINYFFDYLFDIVMMLIIPKVITLYSFDLLI